MLKVMPMSRKKISTLPKVTKSLEKQRSPEMEQAGTSVLSKELFAPGDSVEGYVTEVTYSRMAAIDLPVNVPNPLLFTKTNVWQVALGLKQDTVKKIAEGKLLVKKGDTGDKLPFVVSDITTSPFFDESGEPNYCIGGDALLYLAMKQFDLDNPTGIYYRYRVAVAHRYIPKAILKNYDGDVADLVTEEVTDIHLFSKFYFDTSKVNLPTDGIRRFSFSSPGLTITDHSGAIMYSSDKLNFDCGESTEEFLELYEDELSESFSDDDTSTNQISVDSEYTEDEDEDEDEEIVYVEEDEDEDILEEDFEDMSFLDNVVETKQGKKDSVENHQYDELGVFEVLTGSEGMSRLYDSILSMLPVIPVGYRKAFEGTVDCKTILYDKIFTKCQDLKDTLEAGHNISADDFAESYTFIYQLIRALFLGDDAAFLKRQRFDPKKFRSINDEFKSKQGLIRATLEGGRFDYTARTVIVSSPTMNIDCCGIPVEIVAAIFRPFLAKKYAESLVDGEDSSIMDADIPAYIDSHYHHYLMWVKKNGKRLNLYAWIGRQPTLHYLGTQPYKVIPVEGQALIISPLVVVPFNADFDGDQMHIEACLTAAAHKEIQTNVLLSQQPKRTPNGGITAVPRLEMIYGLYLTYYGTGVHNLESVNWTASQLKTRLAAAGHKAASVLEENALCLAVLQEGLVSPSDTLEGTNIGRAALCYLLFRMTSGIDEERLKKTIASKDKKSNAPRINAKNFTLTICNEYSREDVPKRLTDMVLLGNGMANRFPPRLTLDVPDSLKQKIRKMVADFNTEMYNKKDLVNLGLQSLDAYDILYSEGWSELSKKIDEAIAEMMPIDNGFALMANTGSKGDSGVLRQLFGVKGIIKQVLDRPFNCILSDSYSDSLNGVDHYCSAFGARDGLTDKVLSTSKPGYLSRKLEHAGATQSIVCKDCGTVEGIEMTILDIVNMLTDTDPNLSWYFWDAESYENAKTDRRYLSMYESAKKYVAKKIIGRNVVVNRTTQFVATKADAERVINECWGEDFPELRGSTKVGSIAYKPIVMRSPVTCKCPICKVCYGADPATGENAPATGAQVGFIAAQAISEPGTQMTMKNFQKGGVAGSANLTSSFDIICAYFDMQGRSKNNKIMYDYVAPVASVVKEKRSMDGTKVLQLHTITDLKQAAECIKRGAYDEIVTKGTSLKKVIEYPEGVVFKKVVQAGESVILGQKYIDPKQLLTARGCASVLKYLALQMTDIYQDSDVCSVYIETILSGMLLGKLLESVEIKIDGHKVVYPAGTMISRSLLSMVDDSISENIRVTWLPVGIKQLPKYKPDSMESAIMESMSTYLPKAAFLQPVDTCVNPILRVALNQGIYKKGRKYD